MQVHLKFLSYHHVTQASAIHVKSGIENFIAYPVENRAIQYDKKKNIYIYSTVVYLTGKANGSSIECSKYLRHLEWLQRLAAFFTSNGST